MANLDDFFAKKDKKKIKTFNAASLSSKFSEDVAAIPLSTAAPSATAKKVAPEKKKEEPVAAPVSTEQPIEVAKPKPAQVEPEEEEWAHEFEEEKERDYSGLKIQKLQIQDQELEEDEDEEDHELNEEGELIKREPAGPWNKLAQPAQPAAPVKVKEVAPVEPLPNTTGGVYIPPSKRAGVSGSNAPSSASASARSKGKKNQGPLDISNAESFPSLGQAQAIEDKNYKLKRFDQQERGFTEAKPSRSQSSRTGAGDQDGPRLNLGNKFHALYDEDS